MTAHPQIGDWVRTQYHQTGQVKAIHARCPESDSWLNAQAFPVTTEQVRGIWVSVLVHGGGSVVQPVDTVQLIASPGPLDNAWAEHYGFEQAAPAGAEVGD